MLLALFKPRPWAVLSLIALAVTLTSCSAEDLSTGPNPSPTTDEPTAGNPGGFVSSITVADLGQTVAAGPTRVEIKLLPGELVAREVEVELPEDLADEEAVESRITGLDPADVPTWITLRLGGLQIDFTTSTRFRGDDGADLTASEFAALVGAALAAGKNPPVEAKRPPPLEPQAPDDPTFIATELRLGDRSADDEIEINVDEDNFFANPAPTLDGMMRVLGLDIELRIQQGVTELQEEQEEAEGEEEFEGFVDFVGDDSFTLTDGTTFHITPDTEIEAEPEDDDLPSLADVAAALAVQKIVKAEGEAVTNDDGTRTATEVEFEVENADGDNEDDDMEDIDIVEFGGTVEVVDADAGTFRILNGPTIRVVDATDIEDELEDNHLASLDAVSNAMSGGATVTAEGKGVVETADPLTIVAAEVEFQVAGS